jgi:uncharacterized OB-fold protein
VARVVIHPGLFTMPGDPRGPHLLASRCAACGRHQFPAAETCPYCCGDHCEVVAVGTRGSLHLHTVVTTAPPGYRGEVPYGFGVVDLPEGLRVVSRLTSSRLDVLRRGLPMRLEIGPLHRNEEGDEVLSFAYAPSEERDGAGGAEVSRRR